MDPTCLPASHGRARVALAVSPHPDDEVLGCGATLLALRAAGWSVLNFTCSLGRPRDADRRRHELAASLAVLGLEGTVADPPVALGAADDHTAAAERVAQLVADVASRSGAELVLSPSPDDAHHAHATVGRAVAASAGPGGLPANVGSWWAWGLWRDLAAPNLYVGFDEKTLATLAAALACHRGELERNDYRSLLAARAKVGAVLGTERVFGFGTPAPADADPYAETLEARRREHGLWVPEAPGRLRPPGGPGQPSRGWEGREAISPPAM